MAFETSTLVNGEWTTRTLDVNTVLRHYDQQDRQANADFLDVEKAPVLGLLTQTIISSPLAHWILPVRLRDLEKNDVAFIGDQFVQVKELRHDGRLWDVIRKENFGARIRNARVVGSTKAYAKEMEAVKILGTQIKTEDEDIDMDLGEDEPRTRPRASSVLPPQCLLLQLDTGDSVFLMLHQSDDGNLNFVSTRHRVSKPMLGLQPGIHLAVDPSSRYMAVACSEGVFAIYGLHPREDLNQQHTQGSILRHVHSERYVYFHGVIHKMEFLHPSADDEEHIILLILLIVRGKTRMLLYEWETGCNLNEVRAHHHKGHLLEESRQMPLLLIPLTIKSSFILVSEKSMAVCQDILLGTPRFIDFNTRTDPPTSLHHGSGIPLWTSWARPVRLPVHAARRDDIYITREDGLVKFLEIDSEEDEFVRADMNIGDFDCNCGTALASLDYQGYDDKTGDLLITGGDSCAGGTYLVKARHAPVFTACIQNWTPAQDFVTTATDKEPWLLGASVEHPTTRELIPKPDRVFACVGKGSKGAITELRYGFEATLALEIEYGTPIMHAWVLPSGTSSLEDAAGHLFLLSLGDCSALLHLSEDASDITNIDQPDTKFDLSSRTVTAGMLGECMIQVTERLVVITNGLHSYTHEAEEVLSINHEGALLGFGVAIEHAVIHENVVLFTTHFDQATYLKVLELGAIDAVNNDASPPTVSSTTQRILQKYPSNITCIAVCLVELAPCVVVAECSEDSITLNFQPINSAEPGVLKMPATYGDRRLHLDAFVSIEIFSTVPGTLILLCGTRNGLMVTLEVSESTLQILGFRCDRLGATPAIVKRDDYSGSGKAFFVTCDTKVHSLTRPIPPSSELDGSSNRNWILNQIWLTNAMNSGLQQPRIYAMARLRPGLSPSPNGGLLLVAGSQLLLADLSTHPKAVPRNISIGGTPSRLLYSQTLNALIVAASVNGKSTILFVDPDTGADLSMPVDKSGEPIDFVSGLGNPSERAFGLLEWSYDKDGNTWQYIIVSTNSGKLLLLSVDSKGRAITGEGEGQNGRAATEVLAKRNKIPYYTRHRFKCSKPVYSVAGFAEGLFYCSGETLFCETLDLVEKKFKRVAEYKLSSPAFSLSYENGKIFALTSCHSLEIFELVASGDRGSRIIRTHGDRISRYTLHHTMTGHPSERPVSLISDKACSVAGLWATRNTKADTLDTIFEAQLPYSIVRFRSGRCRPIWDPIWKSVANARKGKSVEVPRLGIIPNSTLHSEILGLSIDGSLSHYTMIDLSAWRFLRFLINLATRSPRVCEFTYTTDALDLEPALEPKSMMHIDGDILKRCVEDRCLVELLRIGEETDEAAGIFSKFYELLQGLHGGTIENGSTTEAYVQQAYEDLDFYLRPLL